jgi:transcriptional regulator with XRE-family HTH domain
MMLVSSGLFTYKGVVDVSTIGEKIRGVRKLNDLNLVEFSKFIGVSQGTLSELEKDKYMPPVEVVMAIREKFKVDTDWLLFGSLDVIRYMVL